jgi:hypothetical protein
MTTSRLPFRRLALVALALNALTACGSRARFEIVRPALLDASQVGNTFSVRPFNGVDPRASYYVQSELQRRITQSLNPAIQLLAAGGGIVVGGDIIDHSYREDMSSSWTTCYRSESYRDANGRYQTRQVPYNCQQITRTGYAHSQIRFTVAVGTSGQIVFDRMYENSDSASTNATNGTPAGIDGLGMLQRLVDAEIAEFSRVILPWPDSVVVAFTDCGGGEHCDDAFRRIQASDLAGAEAIYTQILGPYDDASVQVNPDDTDIVARTLFNRGIVRAYSGSYELGMADINRGLTIEPDHDDWRRELAQIEVLAQEQDQLRSQMGALTPQ